jgi:hypothetical protein
VTRPAERPVVVRRLADGRGGSIAAKQAIHVELSRYIVPEPAEVCALPPDVEATKTERHPFARDDVPAVIAKVGTLHNDHEADSGWVTCRMRKFRRTPERWGHAMFAPSGMPIKAAPIGVVTEMRPCSLSASPG